MKSKNIVKSVFILITVVSGLTFFLLNSKSNLVSAKTGGAALYQQNCASCHGGDGKAKTPKGIRKGATDLTKSTISTPRGIKVISNGRENMPGFKANLTGAEISEVMEYIRGFRGK